MQWFSTIATTEDHLDGVKTITDAIKKRLTQIDVLFLFTSTHFNHKADEIVKVIQKSLPGACIVGASAGGIIGEGVEEEELPAISVLAGSLPDVALKAISFSAAQIKRMGSFEWKTLIDIEVEQQPSFVILGGPFSLDTARLLRMIDLAYPGRPKVGGMSSGGTRPGQNILYCGDNTLREGVVVLAMYGDIQLETIVAQGCRAIGTPMKITDSKKNLIRTLDNEPIIDKLQGIMENLSFEEEELFRRSPMLGICMREDVKSAISGDFLVRNILGVSQNYSEMAVGGLVQQGQMVQFHLRDPAEAKLELRTLLKRATKQSISPMGTLLFSCLGRGKNFYGSKNYDTGIFLEHFPSCPVAGFFGNGEIGPIRDATYLHGYTSSFGLFCRKMWS